VSETVPTAWATIKPRSDWGSNTAHNKAFTPCTKRVITYFCCVQLNAKFAAMLRLRSPMAARWTLHDGLLVMGRLSCLLAAACPSPLRAAGHLSSGPVDADGRYVVFSTSLDLVPNDANGQEDVYRYDRQTGEVVLVSVDQNNTGSGNAASLSPVLSADGEVVAFASDASDLAARDANGTTDVFVRDLKAGITTLISVNRFGTNSGNGRSFHAQLSASGRFVAFESAATDLVAMHDANGNIDDVFVHDRITRVTRLVSVNQTGSASGNLVSRLGAISANGQVVVFESDASDLVSNDTNTIRDVFARHLASRQTTLVSVTLAGTGGADASESAVSSDGTLVAFSSAAGTLVPGDLNDASDIFVRNLAAGVTELVSVNQSGIGSGNGASFAPQLSSDGSVVAFVSAATDLAANDGNGEQDVFVRDRVANTTTLVSVNRMGTGSGNGRSDSAALSANGRVVAFVSTADDLTTNAVAGLPNLFVRPWRPAPDVVLAWDPSPTPGVAYRLYAHTNSIRANLDAPVVRVDADTNLIATVELIPGPWHFVVTARKDGLESAPSNEISHNVAPALGPATQLASVNAFAGDGGSDPAQNFDPHLSGNGRVLAFRSLANILIAEDVSGSRPVLLFSVPGSTPSPTPTPTPGAAAFFVESGGLAVMEAEHYQDSTTASGHSWIRANGVPGFAGDAAMQATPNSGTSLTTNIPTSSPRLTYQIRFATAGSYKVWVRGWAASRTDDSLYVGVDGQVRQPVNYDQINVWTWKSAQILITNVGLHEINLWMREDGAYVDRLLLATDSAFTPTGEGPTESTFRTVSNQPPVVQITSPIQGASFAAGTMVPVRIEATDSDGSIVSVTFYVDGGLISTHTTAPFGFDWAAVSGSHRLSVIAMDDSGNTSKSAVDVSVNGAPVLPIQSDLTIVELATLVVTNTATDPDLPANGMSYVLQSGPSGAVISAEGIISWTPTEAQGPSTNEFTVVVTDDGSPLLSATNTFVVVVNEVNSTPTLPGQSGVTIVELAPFVVTNTATDIDLPANVLSYVLQTGPNGAVISAEGIISWTPTEAQGPSTNEFTVVVTDDGSPPLSATNTFVVIVSEVNDAPVLPVQTNVTIGDGTTLVVTNAATDSDIPSNHLTYQLMTSIPAAEISSEGVITWTTPPGQGPGTNVFTTVVTDDGSPPLSATNTFSVVVSASPSVQLTSPASGSIFPRGSTITVTATAFDADGTVASVRFYANGELLTNDTEAPFATEWTPVPGSFQLYGVATDNLGGLATSEPVNVTVTAIGTLTYRLNGMEFELSYPSAPSVIVQFSRDLSEWAAMSALTNPAFSIEDSGGLTKVRLVVGAESPSPLYFRLLQPLP
jgi:hypothetical protein